MEEKETIVSEIRNLELKKKLRVLWLAKAIGKMYMRLGDYLYRNGLISEIVDVDVLTGLYNKNFFDRWVPKILSQAKRARVVVTFVNFDLNDLKKKNDTEGHLAGNYMLKVFAKYLSGGFRDSDVVFRVGGDEFVAVLWSCDTELAIKKVETIKVSLEKKGVYFSYGVVDSEKYDSLSRLVSEADALMYEMKREMKAKN